MIVFLIRAHASCEYQLDEASQRETWANVEAEGVNIFWIFADPSIKEIEINDRRVIVPGYDDIENMLKKVLTGIQLVAEIYNPELIVLTTTNTYWDIQRTKKVLKIMEKLNKQFGGNIIKWIWGDTQTIKNGDFYASGPSMFFRSKAYESLMQLDPSDYVGLWDDAAISHHLSLMGFELMPIKRSNIFAHHIFVPRSHYRLKGVIKRQHNRDRMSDIHKFYTTKGIEKAIAYFLIQFRELRRVASVNPLRIRSVLKRELSRARVARGTKHSQNRSI
jgi:hypothetical protein